MIGFIVAIPDMSRGIQKARGRILPFGFLHMLAAARKTRQLNAVLGAVKEEFRNRGVNVLLGKALTQTALARGFEFIDSHLVLESNRLMCAESREFGRRSLQTVSCLPKAVAPGTRLNVADFRHPERSAAESKDPRALF